MSKSLVAAILLFASVTCLAEPEMPSMAGKFTVPKDLKPTVVPLIIEGDQILLEVEAKGPAGKRKLLVNLNMGHGFSGWMAHIYQEIGFVRHSAVSFSIGGVPIEVAPGNSAMLDDAAYPARQIGGAFFFTHKVEGSIQCGVLQNFDITLDYSQKTLTLAAPGTLPHDGAAVPIRTNEATGVSTVDFIVNGQRYPMVIDVGGAYTWIRPSTAEIWLKAHPEWARAKGAVGAANYWMMDLPAEENGTVMRLPEVQIGPMKVANVGIFGSSQIENIYDEWQKDNTPEPVIAWLGANVLKHYRITIDYKAHMSWWKKIDDIDPHELDQVGLTFIYEKGVYSVGSIATKDGKPTATGVEKSDKLTAIDDKPVAGWSRDQIFAALHGKPGDIHRVTIERSGKSLTVPLPVSAF